MTNVNGLPASTISQLLDLFPRVRLPYCPLKPTARQEAFLRLTAREVFYGGAAGGGKTVAMLMAALQYADVPGYAALLLRPSLVELQLAGGLIELSHSWLTGTKARWSGDTKTWRFPTNTRSGSGGASLAFGYLSDTSDVARYAGTSYSFLGFDELTRFEETHYTRMFRALRQPTNQNLGAAPDGTRLTHVPPRVRATSNPGGTGHAWVKDRFVEPTARHPGVIYLPSRLADNQHLDRDSYLESLGQLPTAERERLEHGNWEIPDDGELFRRDWFQIIEPHQLPTTGITAVRYWDLAATEPSPANRDPDWTVGLLLTHHRASGTYYIADIVRERKAPGAIEKLVRATAERDSKTVRIVLEKEPGAAGVHTSDHYPSTESYVSVRREQKLVLDYKRFIEAKGSKVARFRIQPTAEAKPLLSDVYDETRNNLIEAKGTGSREAVRMVIGQLADYGRFTPADTAAALLLPERPRDDLEKLLASQGISCVWRVASSFADNADGRFTA